MKPGNHRTNIHKTDNSLLVYIPAGEFEMGDNGASDCPKHQVELDGYWIGAYCVTNRQYTQFVKATGHRVPDQADFGEPVWKNGVCLEEVMNHPVVCVSWDDCAAYAQWAELALPTEAQWEKAGRGPKGWIYPWGNEWDEKRSRNVKTKGNDRTAAVDDYASGVSDYGTYQQCGNVWEWCADWYGSAYYTEANAIKNPTGPVTGSARLIRGGCWLGDESSRGARRSRIAPGSRGDGIGFRLVSHGINFQPAYRELRK